MRFLLLEDDISEIDNIILYIHDIEILQNIKKNIDLRISCVNAENIRKLQLEYEGQDYNPNDRESIIFNMNLLNEMVTEAEDGWDRYYYGGSEYGHNDAKEACYFALFNVDTLNEYQLPLEHFIIEYREKVTFGDLLNRLLKIMKHFK